jgi:hypothetical protein
LNYGHAGKGMFEDTETKGNSTEMEVTGPNDDVTDYMGHGIS